MPELPEVQTAIDDLTEAGLPGSRIQSADVRRPATVRPLSPEAFAGQVRGLRFGPIRRHGKFIIFTMSHDFTILAHLRMTGQFELSPLSEGTDPHDRLVFFLEDDRLLRFHDTRTFGRLICTRNPGEVLDRLGPDALDPDLTASFFIRKMRSRHRQIKALLLDQGFIAGLGNIYCDEGLFAARINPLRRSDTLDEDEGVRLFEALRTALRTGLANRGTSLGNGETNYISGGRRGENLRALQIYGRDGENCNRCGGRIEKIYIAQRGTHYCPRCQPLQRK